MTSQPRPEPVDATGPDALIASEGSVPIDELPLLRDVVPGVAATPDSRPAHGQADVQVCQSGAPSADTPDVPVDGSPPSAEASCPRTPDTARRVSSVAPADDDHPAFLTPRVVDQGAFDELAATLRTLIDDASAVADRLDGSVRTAEQAADVPDAVTQRIQERLRLGARMMQALQVQLGSAETAAVRLEEVQAAAEAATQRLDERADLLGTAIEDRARAAAAGVVRSEQLAQAIGRRIEAVEQRVQSARDVAEASSATALEAATEVTCRAGEAREIARQCQEARSELGGALLAGAARIDEMTGRGETILEGIEERLAQAEAAAERVASAAHALDAATRGVDDVTRLCGRLEGMLERLAPWERFLIHAEIDADGLPRPAGQMVEALRTGIGEDMARLSATMRELAQRVDAFDPEGEESAAKRAAATLRFQA